MLRSEVETQKETVSLLSSELEALRREHDSVAMELRRANARLVDLQEQVESGGLIAFFSADSRTSTRIPDALRAYWQLRAMRFPDDKCRQAVARHLDNHDAQVDFILSQITSV